MDDIQDQTPSPAPVKKRHHWLHWFWRGPFWLLVGLALVLAGALWWLDTEAGHAWILQKANATGMVRIGKLQGSLYSNLVVNDLVVDTPEVHVTVDRIDLSWRPQELIYERVGIDALDVGSVRITSKPQPPNKPASPPPTSLDLPIAIRLDQLQLARLEIVDTPLIFTSLKASLHSDGELHQLKLSQLLTPRGSVEGDLQLDGDAPFKTVGQLQFHGHLDGKNVQAGLQLNHNLRDLEVQGRLQGEIAQASVSLRADVFADYSYTMLRELRLTAERVNPKQLMGSLPQASLSAQMTLVPRAKDRADGTLVISNSAAATLDEEAIPLTDLSSSFTVTNDRLDLLSFEARLLGGAKVTGKGEFRQDKLNATFKLDALDIASLIKRQPPTRLSGDIALSGPYKAPDVLARLTDTRYRASANVDLGWINPAKERRLAIRKLDLTRGAASVALAGEFALDGKQDFKATGKFAKVNPAEYVAAPVGSISGDFSASGQLQPTWQGQVQYKLVNSMFSGQPLAGQGEARLDAKRMVTPGLWLQLGTNRVDAKGALGAPADQLNLHIEAPHLADIGQGFAGTVNGDASLRGGFKRPEIQGKLAAHGLKTPFGVQVEEARVDARLFADLNSPIHADVELMNATGFDASVSNLKFNLEGTRGQHHVTLAMQGKYQQQPVSADFAASGGLDAQWTWQGRIERLLAQGPLKVELMAPTMLTAGTERVALADTRLKVGNGQIHIARLDMNGSRLSTAGELQKAPLSDYLVLAGVKNLSSDMLLSGRWDLTGADVLDGFVELQRDSGDIRLQSGGAPQAFTLSALHVRADARQSRIALSGLVSSERFGTINLDGNTQIDWHDKRIAPGAPLAFNAVGNIEKLDKIAPLISSNIALAGAVRFEVHRTGSLEEPRISGQVDGQNLDIRDTATGLTLREGTVHLSMLDNRLTLKQFEFHGGQGTLRADGTMDIGKEGPHAEANITADRLTLINKPDMQLIVSGKGLVGYDKDGISVKGNMRADHGLVRYQAAGEPHLSDDVVLTGAPQREDKANVPLAALQFDVDLGDDFTFKGYGLDARLTGALRLRASPNQSLSAHGTVSVEDGKYAAYGQNLSIERGVLSFSGPLDNPGLDILAMRRGLSVEAGVSVKGTASSPRVTLYSEPAVPDNEKLAWLLFGHGTDSMDKGDAAVMVQALNGLLGGSSSGEGFSQELLGSIGIDEVGMSTDKHADGTTTQIVSIGKRLTDKVSIAFDKSLDGLEDAIKLTLRLSRNWSLVTRFGAYESTLDATYNISFDKVPW
ncbi:translocation and assembly module TamB [Silvimonas terrae]|uniref:Translocation and assembly module TamB n=1 Tax=Silvimonas terrae TaxID=300266 RepID=A0A840RM55_9NEIS|nr:translocation/assembly module TamB domain-containing protein [Silvimonas terrae]MBB5193608.1 translocation and assembly module TamB [Silvimonas terrae]